MEDPNGLSRPANGPFRSSPDNFSRCCDIWRCVFLCSGLSLLPRLVKERRRVQDGRWSTFIVSLLIFTITSSFLRVESNFPFVVELHSMTLDATTWMLATLNECCERYFGWMLNECKGTSGPSSSGLWYPGTLSVAFFVFQAVTQLSITNCSNLSSDTHRLGRSGRHL